MDAGTIVYCYLLEFLQIDRDPGTGPGRPLFIIFGSSVILMETFDPRAGSPKSGACLSADRSEEKLFDICLY